MTFHGTLKTTLDGLSRITCKISGTTMCAPVIVLSDLPRGLKHLFDAERSCNRNRENLLKYSRNIIIFLFASRLHQAYISKLARPHVKILQYAVYLAISIISDNIHGGQRFWLRNPHMYSMQCQHCIMQLDCAMLTCLGNADIVQQLHPFSFSSVIEDKAFHVRNSIGVEYFTLLTTVPDLFSIKPSFNCTLSILLNFSLLRGGVAGLFVTLIYALMPGLNGILAIGVPIYTVLLTTMAWRAISRVQFFGELWTWTKLCSCIGSICFVISDTLLGFHYFHSPLPYSQVSIMLTYYAAQLGIALSAVDSKNNSNNRISANKG
ncbi:Transmembrane protein 86A [Atta colombica]|uniref:lysoplasmalogenase n=1 Tax=Atta colombica TaxID=520822 RepID=A0A195BKF9_9HYME|nr:Transmembrane protein 86A [Atta colombica]